MFCLSANGTIVAASLSQFSAAVADPYIATGNLYELTEKSAKPQITYLAIGVATVKLTSNEIW